MQAPVPGTPGESHHFPKMMSWNPCSNPEAGCGVTLPKTQREEGLTQTAQ